MAYLTLSAFPSPAMVSTSCSKREQKKAYSQQLFNNRALGEVSSQASLSVGSILKFLLNFSDSILATLSGVCTVEWAFQRGFSLACASNFWAHAHGWLQKWAEAEHLSWSEWLVGTVTTMQTMAALLECNWKMISRTWFPLTAISILLFFFGVRFLPGVWGAGKGSTLNPFSDST